MYGPAQLGLYVLGLTLIQMTNVVAQFGMDNGVVRHVALYRAEEDVPRGTRDHIISTLGAARV
jgi:O-antigen/teichoic acid export membrane protein